MSLTFGVLTNDTVAIAASADIDSLTNFTVWMWCYPTDTTGGNRFFHKANAAGTERITFNWGSPAGRTLFFVDRATTDSLQFTDDFTTNAWQFAVGTFDEGAGQGCRMYRGTLTSAVVECTYVGSGTNGSGAVSVSDGPLNIGNRFALDRSFGGRIAPFGFINRTLTLGELRSLQFRSRVVSGTRSYLQLGFNGVSTQPDWSGYGNSGTVGGAPTQSAHVPLISPWSFST